MDDIRHKNWRPQPADKQPEPKPSEVQQPEDQQPTTSIEQGLAQTRLFESESSEAPAKPKVQLPRPATSSKKTDAMDVDESAPAAAATDPNTEMSETTNDTLASASNTGGLTSFGVGTNAVKRIGPPPVEVESSDEEIDLHAFLDLAGSTDPSKHDYDDIEEVVFRKLEGDEQIVKKLPSNLQSDRSKEWLYEPGMAAWHKSLRGMDAPSPQSTSVGSRLKATGGSGGRDVAIDFFDLKHQLLYHGGFWAKPKTNEPEERCVKVEWITHSQCPGFKLIIDMGFGHHAVTVWFFANTIFRGESDVCIDHDIGEAAKATMSSDLVARIQSQGDGVIWSTTTRIWSDSDVASGTQLPGSIPTRPQITGIDSTELNRILVVGDAAITKGDVQSLTYGRWIIWGLMRCSQFSFYRTWTKSALGLKVQDSFARYMTMHITNVIRHGDWPHYERQAQKAGVDLHAFSTKLRDFEPPRCMVKKWRIKVQNQTAIAAEPEEWASFPHLDTYPSAAAASFGHRLGIERSRGRQRHSLDEMFKNREGQIMAHFTELHKVPGSYYIQMSLPDLQESIYGDVRREDRPEAGSRVTVSITQEGVWSKIRLSGAISEDVMRSGVELSAVVFAHPAATRIPSNTYLLVTVEMPEDATPCDRQNAAILDIVKGLDHAAIQRDHGVDIPHHVLGVRPCIDPSMTGFLYNKVRNVANAERAFQSVIGRWTLNERQLDAAMSTFKSTLGLSVIHGPPGCGKTHTVMAIGHALVAAGKMAAHIPGGKRRIMVCAGSNAATDNAMDHLLKWAGPNSKLSICAFRGGSKRQTSSGPQQTTGNHSVGTTGQLTDAEKAELAQKAELDTFNDALFDYIDEVAAASSSFGESLHPKLEYHLARSLWLDNILREPNHNFYRDTKDLKKWRRRLIEGKFHGFSLQDVVKIIRKLDDRMMDRYWDQVDFVFVTNSSSAHPILIEHAKPDVLISDEAAQTTLADMATPAAAHMRTIQTWIACGDHKQQGPAALSRGVNEMFDETQTPLFTKWINDKTLGGRFWLTEQGRMRPIHREYVSKIFYDDTLTDGAGVLVKPSIEYTLEEAHSRLGLFWNKRLRIGVDISGDGVYSEGSLDGQSLHNNAEADTLVSYVKFLLEFIPGGPSTRRVQASDILVITPYSGQASAIRFKLSLLRDSIKFADPKDIRVEIMTSGSVQGHEGNIVLLSLTRNIVGQPVNLGFVRSRKQLCVNFSRTKVHMVTFGNLVELVQLVRDGEQDFTKRNRGEHMGRILHDFDENGDLLSGEHLDALMTGVPPLDANNVNHRLRVARPVRSAQNPGFQHQVGRGDPTMVADADPKAKRKRTDKDTFDYNASHARVQGLPARPVTGLEQTTLEKIAPVKKRGRRGQAGRNQQAEAETGPVTHGEEMQVDEAEAAESAEPKRRRRKGRSTSPP